MACRSFAGGSGFLPVLFFRRMHGQQFAHQLLRRLLCISWRMISCSESLASAVSGLSKKERSTFTDSGYRSWPDQHLRLYGQHQLVLGGFTVLEDRSGILAFRRADDA